MSPKEMDSFITDLKALARTGTLELYTTKPIKETDKLSDNLAIHINNKKVLAQLHTAVNTLLRNEEVN